MALTKLTSVAESVAKRLLVRSTKIPYTFDSVEDMKASELEFPEGKTIQCVRYYSGGKAIAGLEYEVQGSGVVDDYGDHTLGNGNTAILKQTGLIDAEQYGAVETESTLAVQAAANAASGHEFTFGTNSRKLITDQVVFPNSVHIVAGLVKNSPASGNKNKPAIWLQASNSSIDGVDIEGEDIVGTWPVLAFSNSGIRIGPIAPSVNNFLHEVHVGSNIKISKMKGEGILIYHCKDSSIASPVIQMCGYAGILCKSLIDSSIDSPKIQDIHDEGAFVNHYGITLTKETNEDLVNFPPSTNIQVNQPIIKNVVNWLGFDTHAGVNITTNWIRCYNCAMGFNIQYDDETVGINAPRNIKLRGYASGRASLEETKTGCTILGADSNRARNIELDLVLENYGSDTNQQLAAITMGVCNNIKGKVELRGVRGNGLYTSNVCSDVDLDITIRGITKTSGSAYYARLIPSTLTNFKLSGDWGGSFGNADTAGIGIFYDAPQSVERDVLLDLTMDVPSGAFISDGVSNKYHDLSWVLKEQVQFSRNILAGGTSSEVFPVVFPRPFRGAWSSITIRNDLNTVCTINATAHPLLTSRISGILNPTTVNLALSTLDGSNLQGGGFAVSTTIAACGIVFKK